MEWTDWNAAIDKNRAALKRVLATLVAMAGMAGGTSTLPRLFHRAILLLLRPAESAARRLVIAASRGVVVELPPLRPCEPKSADPEPTLHRFGIAVTLSLDDVARAEAAKRAAALRATRPRSMSLPLLDPLNNPSHVHRRYVPEYAAPRITSLDVGAPFRPLPLSPDDPIDAARLSLRLQALASTLDDLPEQAKRFARWKALRDAALAQDKQAGGTDALGEGRDAAGEQNGKARGAVRSRRTSPQKPRRQPGWRRKPVHEVHEVLDVVHGLAVRVLEAPDTS